MFAQHRYETLAGRRNDSRLLVLTAWIKARNEYYAGGFTWKFARVHLLISQTATARVNFGFHLTPSYRAPRNLAGYLDQLF